MERSENQESFIAGENQQTKQAFIQEEQRTRSMAQEFQRLREVAAEEITVERQKYAQLEANQRPNRKANVFYELAPKHAYLKALPEVRHICMVQPEILKTQMKFIMDTGCGHDLVSQDKVTRNDLESFVGDKTMHFQTANGTTDSDIVARFSTNCFNEPVEAHILESAPSVLSVGRRCINHGFLRMA